MECSIYNIQMCHNLFNLSLIDGHKTIDFLKLGTVLKQTTYRSSIGMLLNVFIYKEEITFL